MTLDGKIALVTGGGRGIGLGCATALARRGATIVLNDRPGSAELAAAVEEVRATGATCHPVEADAFSRRGCEELVRAAIDVAGRIDVLVSSPAFSRRGAFLEFDPDEFERVIAGTLTAGFHVAQLVGRHMVERGGGGRMVFVSSVQAEMPLARSVAYNAAKAGLNHMVRTIAVELSGHRITANAVEPGWTDTPGERNAFDEETIAAGGALLPWGRLGTADDVGSLVAFLASDEAEYVTGTVIPVDGGFRFKDCRADVQPPLRR